METYSFKSSSDFYQKLYSQFSLTSGYELPADLSLKKVEAASQNFESDIIYSSKGQINHGYSLPLDQPKRFYELMSHEVKKLELVDPHNIYLTEAKKKLKKMTNILDGLCQIYKSPKRGFFLPFLVSFLVTVGTLWATGSFSDGDLTKQIFEDKKEEQNRARLLDEILEENLVILQDNSNELSVRLRKLELQKARNELGISIGQYSDSIIKNLLVMINPQEYDYTNSAFLDHVVNVAARYMAKLENEATGFNEINFLLGISRSYSLILTENQDRMCSNSKLLTIFESVSPNPKYAGRKTENKYKYSLPGDKYLWVNPNLILPPSKFRPTGLYSQQRTIVSDQSVGVKPYNNTVMYLKTNKSFQGTITCPNETKVLTFFPNPVLKLPLHCELQSLHLNVSAYKIETNFENVNVDYSYEKVDQDTLVYHPNMPLDINEEQMSEYIDKLYNLREHIRQEEMESIQKRNILEVLDDGIQNIFQSIWSIFATPAHFVMGVIAMIITTIFTGFITYLILKCRK